MCIYIYIHIYAYIVYIYIYVYTCVYVHNGVHMYMVVYMCIFICISIYVSKTSPMICLRACALRELYLLNNCLFNPLMGSHTHTQTQTGLGDLLSTLFLRTTTRFSTVLADEHVSGTYSLLSLTLESLDSPIHGWFVDAYSPPHM